MTKLEELKAASDTANAAYEAAYAARDAADAAAYDAWTAYQVELNKPKEQTND